MRLWTRPSDTERRWKRKLRVIFPPQFLQNSNGKIAFYFDSSMTLEFLGTAGYHPSENRHTSCVFIPDAAPDHAFVLDAGTGFFRLNNRPLPANLHIFLSHPHLDHVMGLTFLLNVAHNRDVSIKVYGDAHTLQAVNDALFQSALFPLGFEYPHHEVEPQTCFEVAGVAVETFPLTHPGGSLALRFRWPDGKTLAYVTDTFGDAKYVEFIADADVLIHERNFPDSKAHLAHASGHCTSSALVAAAHQSRCKTVIATHFDPLTAHDPLQEDDIYHQIPGIIGAHDGLVCYF